MINVWLVAYSQPVLCVDPRRLSPYVEEVPCRIHSCGNVREITMLSPYVARHAVFTFLVDGVPRYVVESLSTVGFRGVVREDVRCIESRIVGCLECLTRVVMEALVDLGEMGLEEVVDELLGGESYEAWLTALYYASSFVDVYAYVSKHLLYCLSIAFDFSDVEDPEKFSDLILETLRSYVELRFRLGVDPLQATSVLPPRAKTCVFVTMNLEELRETATNIERILSESSPKMGVAKNVVREVVQGMVRELERVGRFIESFANVITVTRSS